MKTKSNIHLEIFTRLEYIGLTGIAVLLLTIVVGLIVN